MQNRRESDRKVVDAVYFSELSDLGTSEVLASSGHIVDASSSGFLILFHRDHSHENLKGTLSFDHLLDSHVSLYLPQMEIDLDGKITRTKHIGKGYFEIGIAFSEDTPVFWRECLKDLLPQPGEMDNH